MKNIKLNSATDNNGRALDLIKFKTKPNSFSAEVLDSYKALDRNGAVTKLDSITPVVSPPPPINSDPTTLMCTGGGFVLVDTHFDGSNQVYSEYASWDSDDESGFKGLKSVESACYSVWAWF